jgi:hypothetical protein
VRLGEWAGCETEGGERKEGQRGERGASGRAVKQREASARKDNEASAVGGWASGLPVGGKPPEPPLPLPSPQATSSSFSACAPTSDEQPQLSAWEPTSEEQLVLRARSYCFLARKRLQLRLPHLLGVLIIPCQAANLSTLSSFTRSGRHRPPPARHREQAAGERTPCAAERVCGRAQSACAAERVCGRVRSA